MGAFGTGSFENDDADEWVMSFPEAISVQYLRDSIAKTLYTEYPTSPNCCRALAAAEVVNRSLNRDTTREIPEEIRLLLNKDHQKVGEDLRQMSLDAVEKIMVSSELRDLWAEASQLDEWLQDVAQLVIELKRDG